MDKKVRQELLRLSVGGGFGEDELYQHLGITPNDIGMYPDDRKLERLEHYRESIDILVNVGFLQRVTHIYWRITYEGLEELYELEHPVKSHFKRNAFRYASIAASISTTIAVIVGIVVG